MSTVARRAFLDKVETDRTVLELARERVSLLFERFDHVAVAFSGGKDSTVILHLVLEERERRGISEPLDVLFYDEEAIAPETEAYVRRVRSWDSVEMRWFCLPIRHVNACSPAHPWWFPWAPEDVDKWCRRMPEEMTPWPEFPIWPVEARPQIAEYAPAFFPVRDYGKVAYVMGIRSDESMTRLRAVTRRMKDNWLVHYHSDWNAGNVTKAYPIYDWRTPDVWTAPALFGWDYNRAYDLQELYGFHGSRQRIAPPYGAEPMQMLGMYASCWPELWDRMCERVPGAATAARYSRTELYSFRARPEPGPGETWKELINRYILRHAVENQTKLRGRIADEIDWHYRKTEGAKRRQWILPTAPHPMTGMSCEFLAMIALRGDFKKRRTAGWELGENTQENMARKTEEYRQQYEQLKSEGILEVMAI